MEIATLLIKNELGLHARAAARLVKLSNKFESDIYIEKDRRQVNAKSIMGVMMLAATKGSTITVRVKGRDEAQAISAIKRLINDKFGEE